MTKNELFSAMREHGYSEPEFFSDLEADEELTGTINNLIRLMGSGETCKAWEEIEKLHDEFIYFGTMGDESIIIEEV